MDRRSSGEQVATHIRRLIFRGDLVAGDRIRQDEIAAELGVSRIPVREGVIALEREGWVTMEPHRGAFVGRLDEDSVLDHYELIGLIYGLAARRAIERSAPGEAAELADRQRELRIDDDPEVFAKANEHLIRHLLDMARSDRLSSVLRVMSAIVPGNFFVGVPGAQADQVRGTRRLVAAVVDGDPDAAAVAAADLLGRQGRNVCAVLP